MVNVVLAGLLTGLALIVAVGAQNAFLLRQGVRGEHVLPLVLVCVVSDAVGIAAGIAGLGALLERWPAALPVLQVAGGVYLLAFGLQSAVRAWRPSALTAGGGAAMSLPRALLMMLALTWLNPHFYLDTLLMLGTVANSFGDLRWVFFAGAFAGSVIWFPALGFGARLLRGLFARPSAWRVLDSAIAVVMGALGIGLLAH
jgi:L-lysine exporter family protein LysE/ArgO